MTSNIIGMFTLMCVFINTGCNGMTLDSAVGALVYTIIQPGSFDKCIRIFNGTKQIGCQAEFSGNVGVLFHINQTSDIGRVKDGLLDSYIILVHADFFNSETVKTLQNSKKVNGIIVYTPLGYTGKSGGWSPEPRCPRYRYGLYNEQYGPEYSQCQYPWNELGDSLSTWDINFPIFFMKNITASNIILDCHDKNNLDGEYPYCAAQMHARMDGAVSTETCIRRTQLQNNLSPATYCALIGGQTVFGALNDLPENDDRPVILITAALDSRAFILSSSVPGANSATGFITLLSVAQIMGNVMSQAEKDPLTHRVIFVIFDGEAFDNTASTRMVYDMSNGQFPFSDPQRIHPQNFDLSKVEYVIEIGQVGHVLNTSWMHYDPVSFEDPKVNVANIINIMTEESSSGSIKFVNQSRFGLPPSSLQSLLKSKNVSGIVVSDFLQNYSNKYYFSLYDTPDKLGIHYLANMTEIMTIKDLAPLSKKLGDIAIVLSKTIFKLSTGKKLRNVTANVDYIAHTLYCFLFNDSCNLFLSLVDSSTSYKASNAAPNRYTSVYSSTPGTPSYMLRNLLVRYVGRRLYNITVSKNCTSGSKNDGYAYVAFRGNGTQCYKATVYVLDSRSPSAFISGYDYSNGPYPSWSESQWGRDAFKMNIFLVQDSVSQGMVLFSGLVMLFFSFLFVFIVNRKTDILFSSVDVL